MCPPLSVKDQVKAKDAEKVREAASIDSTSAERVCVRVPYDATDNIVFYFPIIYIAFRKSVN